MDIGIDVVIRRDLKANKIPSEQFVSGIGFTPCPKCDDFDLRIEAPLPRHERERFDLGAAVYMPRHDRELLDLGVEAHALPSHGEQGLVVGGPWNRPKRLTVFG